MSYPEKLPCKVILVGPSGRAGFSFGKGVETEVLLVALKHRAEYQDDNPQPSPEAEAFIRDALGDRPSVRELIASEIHDYFSNIGGAGFEPDHRELTRRVLACLPIAFAWEPKREITWHAAQEMADRMFVDAALRDFSQDPTGDHGVMVVKAVMDEMPNGLD